MVAFEVATFSFCSTEEWKTDQLKSHAHNWVLLRHLLAAVEGQGRLFHGNMEEKSPPRSARQISAYRGQPSLEVLVFTALKVTWSSAPPAEMYLQERFWLSCRCWHPYTSFCTDDVMTGSSLNPPECCGLQQGCVWSQQALAHPHGGRDVTTVSYCLSTRSGHEAHHCYIISLFNKTSKIFNLAVSYHISWVQTALFYMSTCINIVIPTISG